MNRVKILRFLIPLLCGVMLLGLIGCDTSDSDDSAPTDISGTWSALFTSSGEEPMYESITFAQASQQVSGSYTFGLNTWTFTGTYASGAFAAVDTDGWVMQFSFSGDTATGTISGDGEVWSAVLTR